MKRALTALLALLLLAGCGHAPSEAPEETPEESPERPLETEPAPAPEGLSLKVEREVYDPSLTRYTYFIYNNTDHTVEFGEEINCHHNYASLENHYHENVWVHRKGATRVREGEMAVIPGAMGSYSYVVEGKGNKESFCTSSHGAGRSYSRSGAMKAFSIEQVMVDLKEQDVVLGKRKKNDVAEECRFAYKDIDQVMEQQQDMVTPVRKLKTVGVVKG